MSFIYLDRQLYGNSHPLSEELQALEHLMALYGSPRVVKAHAMLRALVCESEAQNPQVRAQFAKTRLEIGKELGSETQGLSEEALQQLLFATVDKVSVSPKASAYQDHQSRMVTT